MLINENTIEQGAIDTLVSLGWQYTHGSEIIAGGAAPWRLRIEDTVLQPLLCEAVARLNPSLPESARDEAVGWVCRSAVGDLAERNRCFYRLLCEGVRVEFDDGGERRVEFVRLVDFQNPGNNRFDAVNQFTVAGRQQKRRPDLVCFVNGLPLALFELKNPLTEHADIQAALRQIQTYKAECPDLFAFNQVLVVSDGTHTRIGSLTADFERFMPWKVVDEKSGSRRIVFENELENLLRGLFEPAVFLDYIRHFVLFERGGDNRWIKKIAAYHQFYGVNEAVDCTLLAAAPQGDRRIGVMWHTQGSGKSISMLFYAGKLLPLPELGNPTIVVVTDRSDLDGQLFATFSAGRDIIRSEPVQADSRDALRLELAKRESGGVVFTTIQKFALWEGEREHPLLNSRSNIIVISDEAHRSQYGFNTHLDAESGATKTGYARHLRQALPNASFIGFTGTPVSLEDRDTQQVFGRYVSIYDLQDAVSDGATVKIAYEPRQIALRQSGEYAEIMSRIDGMEDENSRSVRILEELIGLDSRLDALAADFVAHFEQRCGCERGKALLVGFSRKICVRLYNKIVALRPDWHSGEVMQGQIKVMMTGSAGDPDELKPHIYSHQQKKELEKRFKDPDDPLKVVIVRDMWLTGFDAPCCHTIYIDKPMKGHNLMQAIARVNRVFKGKSAGLVVDYIGIGEELKQATAFYTNAEGKGEPAQNIDSIFQKMLEYIQIIEDQFATPVQGRRFDLATALTITEPQPMFEAVLQAANHIAALDSLKPADDPKNPTPRRDSFMQAVKLAKKGFALCGMSPRALPYQMTVAFADAVRHIIRKQSESSGTDSGSPNLFALDKLLARAISAQGVIDLLEMMEKERPNLNLLSPDFLEMVKNSGKESLWALSVERYLRSEIKQKAAGNLVLRKDFEQRLSDALNRYHNQQLGVIDIIEELIALSKNLSEQLARGSQLGLDAAELAFYDALATNESAVRELGDATLKQLAQEITDQLRRSVSIDWQFKESVRARMRILVRQALKRYKYPPDRQPQAIEQILAQAETLADGLSAI